MVKLKLAVVAVIALAAITISASAQTTIPDGKIVVLNTTKFPAEIGELRLKYEQVDTKFKDRYQKLDALGKQLEQLGKEIEAQKQVLTADKLREKSDQFETGKRQYTREKEDLQQDVEKEVETATKPVRDKLFQFLNNYATKNSIVMIINLAGAAQSGTLAYWEPKADITDDFIAEYNKANPTPASGQPAAPKPATPKPAATKPPANN
ncbi:MAG: OmpH family outer membrane protein [Acidobacteriota bacterium]